MYDTLVIAVPYNGELSRIGNRLSKARDETDLETGDRLIHGMLEDYRFKVSTQSILISCNVSKQHNGNNVDLLTPDQLRDELGKLSEWIGENVLSGKVRRVDVAATLQTEYAPRVYTGSLQSLARFQRGQWEDNDTVHFRTTREEREFYDKVKETGGKLPEQYRGKNLLRYEQRHRKGVAQRLPFLTSVGSLLIPEHWNRLVDIWEQGYTEITKTGDTIVESIKGKIDFNEYAIAHLAAENPDAINGLLSGMGKDARKYIRQAIRKATAKFPKSETGEELDRLIREKAEELKSLS